MTERPARDEDCEESVSVYSYSRLLFAPPSLPVPLPDTMLQSCRQPGTGRVAPQLTRARRTCTPERPTDRSSRWRTIIGCQDTLCGIIFETGRALPWYLLLFCRLFLCSVERNRKNSPRKENRLPVQPPPRRHRRRRCRSSSSIRGDRNKRSRVPFVPARVERTKIYIKTQLISRTSVLEQKNP